MIFYAVFFIILFYIYCYLEDQPQYTEKDVEVMESRARKPITETDWEEYHDDHTNYKQQGIPEKEEYYKDFYQYVIDNPHVLDNL